MPESFSLLKNLRIFYSFWCYYEDLEPLKNLEKLVSISMYKSSVKTLPDFSKLKNFENMDDSNTIVVSSWVNIIFFIIFIQIFLLIIFIFVSHQHFTNKKKFSIHD